MEAADFEERLDALSGRAKFVGVRPMIHDISEPQWMLRPSVRRAFAVLERQQICFDFLVRPVHFPPLLEILEAFPRLRAVLDHIGKPQIGARQWGALGHGAEFYGLTTAAVPRTSEVS